MRVDSRLRRTRAVTKELQFGVLLKVVIGAEAQSVVQTGVWICETMETEAWKRSTNGMGK